MSKGDDKTRPLFGPARPPQEPAHGVAETLPVDGSMPAPGAGTANIGRFEVISKLGEGGMGVVLLAADPQLGRRVALKVLHADGQSTDARRRLLREAQGVAQLTHDNVIVVHEVGTHEGRDYIAMEYVAGGTLTKWQVGRPWQEIVEIYARAGRGLAAAHDVGLVHRDFKPDNVLVGDDGRVRVSDFGLVAAVDSALAQSLSATERSLRDDSILAISLTRTGSIMGTPRYMAPEQHLGERVDARADQFGFCAALYEALYGRPPFTAEVYQVLVATVLAGEVGPVPADSPVPTTIRDAVLRGLSRQRDDRFPSMRELLTVLSAPVVALRPRRRALWVGGAVVALGAGIATIAILGRQAPESAVVSTAAEWKKQGREALDTGNYATAAAAFERALTYGSDPELTLALAKIYVKTKRCAAARTQFDRYISELAKTPSPTWDQERPQLEAHAEEQLHACAEPEPRLTLTTTTTEVLDAIAFDDADRMTQGSRTVDSVSDALRGDLMIRVLEVQAHVASGAPSMREERARGRARTVVDALIAKGGRANRLRAAGIADGTGADRVDFLIVTRLEVTFTDADEVAPGARAALDWLADTVIGAPSTDVLEVDVELAAAAPDRAARQARAEHRAARLRDYLLAAQIPESRLRVRGVARIGTQADAAHFKLVPASRAP